MIDLNRDEKYSFIFFENYWNDNILFLNNLMRNPVKSASFDQIVFIILIKVAFH